VITFIIALIPLLFISIPLVDWAMALLTYSNIYIRQAGMLPTGDIQGSVDFATTALYELLNLHHLDFDKSGSDWIVRGQQLIASPDRQLILLGRLHNSLNRYVEPKKDLDYYSTMRNMKNSFDEGLAPQVWNDKLQKIYNERIRYIINQWENKKNIRVLGIDETFLLKYGVSNDFVDNIIQDLKDKLGIP